MLPATILAILLASGQAALALPTAAFSNSHSHYAGLGHIDAHQRMARSIANKSARRDTATKGCRSTNAANSTSEVEPEALPVSGGGAVADSDDDDDSNTANRAVGLGKSLRVLFPAATSNLGSLSWSTHKDAPNRVALSDAGLRATNIMKLSHDVKTAPDGSKAMEINFSKGSYNFKGPKGGFSFVAHGPDNVQLTTAKEATFAYSIYFQDGFQFNNGGKLPGLMGGESEAAAQRCNGGRKANDCFSSRMMWRDGGKGELYAYIPPDLKGNKGVCNIKPVSHCNPAYGSSLGRGAFTWKTGGWTTMAQRVRLNDVGKANGEIEIFINGESVIKATGMTLRRNSSGRIRAAHVQSFFGGNSREWASPRNQKFWIKDLSLAITEQL